MKKKSIEKRLDSIDKKLNKLHIEEKIIEKEEDNVERKIGKISKEEKSIEGILLNLGFLNLRKRHLFEFISASAGAFLGVGLGRGLLGLDNIARTLPWINVIGILVFVLGLSALLIYRDEKEKVKLKGKILVIQKLIFIYTIAIVIELISLLLFNVPFDSIEVLVKIIIVGSFTAMASAVTFSLNK